MTTGRRWVVLAAVAALLAMPRPGAAQALRPLSKSDLIRMLSGSALSADEIAGIVRRSCTNFTPSDRDRADLRALGAGDDMLRTIDACRRAAEMLRVRVPSPDVTIEAGDEATVRVELRRGGAPARGVTLTLVGSGRIPGTGGEDVDATTDGAGVATFSLPAGRTLATYVLTVAASSGAQISGNPAVTLRVGPAGRVRTEIDPHRIEWQTGQAVERLTVVLRDALGNLVPGQPVELLRDGTPVVPPRASDQSGIVRFTLPATAFTTDGRLYVRVAGRLTDSLDVLLPAPVSGAHTGFVSGQGQRARVGTPLPQPLVFEVRDSANVALADRTVAVTTDNAVADVDADRTDASGRVTIRVRLGERAGPAAVTVAVAGIERRAALLALAGPATQLTVACGDPLGGRVLLVADTTAALTVTARDAHGNAVALGQGVRVAVGNQDIAQVVAVVSDSAVTRVTLRGRAAGSTNLAVTAAGVRANLVTVVQRAPTRGACVAPR